MEKSIKEFFGFSNGDLQKKYSKEEYKKALEVVVRYHEQQQLDYDRLSKAFKYHSVLEIINRFLDLQKGDGLYWVEGVKNVSNHIFHPKRLKFIKEVKKRTEKREDGDYRIVEIIMKESNRDFKLEYPKKLEEGFDEESVKTFWNGKEIYELRFFNRIMRKYE